MIIDPNATICKVASRRRHARRFLVVRSLSLHLSFFLLVIVGAISPALSPSDAPSVANSQLVQAQRDAGELEVQPLVEEHAG